MPPDEFHPYLIVLALSIASERWYTMRRLAYLTGLTENEVQQVLDVLATDGAVEIMDWQDLSRTDQVVPCRWFRIQPGVRAAWPDRLYA